MECSCQKNKHIDQKNTDMIRLITIDDGYDECQGNRVHSTVLCSTLNVREFLCKIIYYKYHAFNFEYPREMKRNAVFQQNIYCKGGPLIIENWNQQSQTETVG